MKDPRSKTILDALRSLPAGTLETAGAALPGQAGAMLQQLALALQSENTEAAEALVASLGMGDPRALDRLLAEGRAAAAGGLVRVKAELQKAGIMVDRLSSLQIALEAGVKEIQAQVAQDPELKAQADALVALLSKRELAEEGKALVQETAQVSQLLERALTPGMHPGSLAGSVNRLQKQLDKIIQDTQSQEKELLPMVEKLSRSTLEKRHPSASGLSRLEAELAGRQGLGSRWRKAMEVGFLCGDLEGTWEAGKRVQAEALARGDFKTAATTAHRLADMAAGQKDTRRELFSRMEEALLLRRLPEYREPAIKMVEDVVERVGELSGATAARVLLMAGQFAEAEEDEKLARKRFRQVLDRAGEDLSFPAELGRAALHLGRLSGHQTHLAAKALLMAQEIGEKLGDRFLFTEALEARVALAIGADDADTAKKLVQGGLIKAGSSAEDLRSRLRQRFGEGVF